MSAREVWSLSFGRWKGVQVRLHMFFLLFAVFNYYLLWFSQRNQAGGVLPDHDVVSILFVVILFLSVLLHELGHTFVARRLGGQVESIVIGPLGGMRPIRIPQDPQAELLAVIAGPLTSLAICLASLAALVSLGTTDLIHLANPFDSAGVISSSLKSNQILSWQTVIGLTCWVNWMLVLVNLIPAYPFDGGRACKALLQSLRPELEPGHAVLLVGHLARLVALGMLVIAVLFRDRFTFDNSPVPIWLALVLLSIFVFFITRVEELHTSQDEETDESFFGYDFSQGYTSLARSADSDLEQESPPRDGLVAKWLKAWKQKQEAKRQATEAEEDRQLDEILARLHEVGQSGLSTVERGILERVSARYRSRNES